VGAPGATGATGAAGSTGIVASGSAGSDNATSVTTNGVWEPIEAGATVTITSTSQTVLVQTSASIEGSGIVEFGINYDTAASLAPQTYLVAEPINPVIPVAVSTSATFTNLSPGRYTFVFVCLFNVSQTVPIVEATQTTAIVF
jgi:hypothetical protein